MIMRWLSANPDAANPTGPVSDDDKWEETVRYHKRKILPHAQWLEFCLKWTAAWDCPTSCKVAKHLILTVYFFTFPACSCSASMHRRDDVRPSLSKCRQVATTGQLCGGLSGMCGVPAFGHTKKCFSASRNWCKVSRYCVYMFLSWTTAACVKLANINGSVTGCAEMVEQARAVCSHFAKTERPLFISTPINSNVTRWNVIIAFKC